MYQTPKVVDQQVTLRDYEGSVRQMLITDLGHEEPTVLLTSDLRTSAAKRITRYAQRRPPGTEPMGTWRQTSLLPYSAHFACRSM
jgi:hypothetical protein